MDRDYPPAEVDPDNPLVKKLVDIQSRLNEKKRGSDWFVADYAQGIPLMT